MTAAVVNFGHCLVVFRVLKPEGVSTWEFSLCAARYELELPGTFGWNLVFTSIFVTSILKLIQSTWTSTG